MIAKPFSLSLIVTFRLPLQLFYLPIDSSNLINFIILHIHLVPLSSFEIHLSALPYVHFDYSCFLYHIERKYIPNKIWKKRMHVISFTASKHHVNNVLHDSKKIKHMVILFLTKNPDSCILTYSIKTNFHHCDCHLDHIDVDSLLLGADDFAHSYPVVLKVPFRDK